jgi:uncharacterized membrane protein
MIMGKRASWATMAVLSIGVALFSYRYLIAVGPLSPEILANLFARPFLALHVAGACTALLIGPFNFVSSIRRRWPMAHRIVGRTYVLACLAGGAGGLVLAFGSTAGPIAGLGFGSLALCWIAANVEGWRSAMQGRFDAHRAWMIRSFAMTFGAVTLRLYLPLFPLIGVPFLDGYRAVSFLCWIPNLVLVEIWLRRASRISSARPASSRRRTATI